MGLEYIVLSSEAIAFAQQQRLLPEWSEGAISTIDAAFLYEVLLRVRPKTILELGVASGVSTAYISQLLKQHLPFSQLHSFDIATHFYADKTKRVGQYLDERFGRIPANVKLHPGVSSLMAYTHAPNWFDLVFIDANHLHPWPCLDLLANLRRIEPGSWVVVHDIRLAELHPRHNEHGPQILFDHWPGERLTHRSIPINIGAIKLFSTAWDNAKYLIECLQANTWECSISPEDLEAVRASLHSTGNYHDLMFIRASQLTAIPIDRQIQEKVEVATLQKPQGTESAHDRLQDGVAGLIKKALAEKVVSQSSVAGITITGNHYQSVELGSETLPGFRDVRGSLLAGFDFRGQTVCDLGSNLGEFTRKAAERQADQVDGYEYDRFFSQLAAYTSVYNYVYTVKHICADVSQPGFMLRSYDVTMCLSAWAYVGPNVEYVCEQTKRAIIVETHEAGSDWVVQYVDKLQTHFPHWCCFGIVPHGDAGSGKHRLWLHFSRRPLAEFYDRRSAELGSTGPVVGVIEVDLERSEFPFLNQTKDLWGMFPLMQSEEVVQRIECEVASFEKRFLSGEGINLSLSGRVYWLAFLLGYEEFKSSGSVKADNIYTKWLRRGLEAGEVDPGLRPLLSERGMLDARVKDRMMLLREATTSNGPAVDGSVLGAFNLTPYHPSRPARELNRVVLSNGQSYCMPNLDGHHRLFVRKLTSRATCRMMTIWDLEYLNYLPELADSTNYKEMIFQYLGSCPVDDLVLRNDAASVNLT